MQENTDRIIKAINFFRQFNSKSDSEIYRKSVLRFCDLVEAEYIKPGPTIEQAEENIKATMF